MAEQRRRGGGGPAAAAGADLQDVVRTQLQRVVGFATRDVVQMVSAAATTATSEKALQQQLQQQGCFDLPDAARLAAVLFQEARTAGHSAGSTSSSSSSSSAAAAFKRQRSPVLRQDEAQATYTASSRSPPPRRVDEDSRGWEREPRSAATAAERGVKRLRGGDEKAPLSAAAAVCGDTAATAAASRGGGDGGRGRATAAEEGGERRAADAAAGKDVFGGLSEADLARERDIAERDAFAQRLRDREAARVRHVGPAAAGTGRAAAAGGGKRGAAAESAGENAEGEEGDGEESAAALSERLGRDPAAVVLEARKNPRNELLRSNEVYVQRVREEARRTYLKKREGDRLLLAERTLQDKEWLFRDVELTAAEQRELQLEQQTLQLAKTAVAERKAHHAGAENLLDDVYRMPQSYDEDAAARLAVMQQKYVEEKQQHLSEQELLEREKTRAATAHFGARKGRLEQRHAAEAADAGAVAGREAAAAAGGLQASEESKQKYLLLGEDGAAIDFELLEVHGMDSSAAAPAALAAAASTGLGAARLTPLLQIKNEEAPQQEAVAADAGGRQLSKREREKIALQVRR